MAPTFVHPGFEKYGFDEIPADEDLYLMDEIWMNEYEEYLVSRFEGGEFRSIGYISYAAKRSSTESALELSWYPNINATEQKRKAYTSFLRNFTEIAVAVMHKEDVGGKDADRDRMLARDQLLLYGSDDVIKAYDAWVRFADIEGHDPNTEGELVSLILLAIRKDLLGKTKVTKEQLNNLNPFNRG